MRKVQRDVYKRQVPGCDTISITGPGEKWKLNYKRYVEVPLDCEVQTVALFFS